MKINKVHIRNFKSVVDLSLDLGSINVFIGENGSGKSNILEALAFTAAAAAAKLDNEFLVSRGIRVTDPRFMRSAFEDISENPVLVDVEDERGLRLSFEIGTSGDTPYPKWKSQVKADIPPNLIPRRNEELRKVIGEKPITDDVNMSEVDKFFRFFEESLKSSELPVPVVPEGQKKSVDRWFRSLVSSLARHNMELLFSDFIIYSPETSALRTFEREGQILPLGIRGEGLLKLLRVLASEGKDAWSDLQQNLGLLDWFSGIEIDPDSAFPEQSVRLRDRFMAPSQPAFDQRSANEGFLYLLFFFALISSKDTPWFFGVENIDTSLNPKACAELMRRLAVLTMKHQKQVLLTTHNPSLLDGLNIHDDNQRLFVVFRNRNGHTSIRRVHPPQPIGDDLPIKLSDAFTRGLLGGIPQNF